MNLGEIRDSIYDFLQADPIRSIWSPTEIDSHIETARSQLFHWLVDRQQGFFQSTKDLDQVTGEGRIALPADFRKLLSLGQANGSGVYEPMHRLNRAPFEKHAKRGRRDAFTLIGHSFIELNWEPDTSATGAFHLVYVYMPPRMKQDEDTPFMASPFADSSFVESLDEWHDLIWIDAARMAAAKEEGMGHVAFLSSRYTERLQQLQLHVEGTNLQEPRFVTVDDDGLDDGEGW